MLKPEIRNTYWREAQSPLRTPRKRRNILILLAAMATVLCIVALFMFSQRHTKVATKVTKPAPVLTVTVTPATVGTAAARVHATGAVAAIDPLTIGATATGLQIISTPVEEGSYVGRGQTLAQLDSSLLRAQLASARARLAAAQASTSKAIQPNRPEDVVAAEQSVAQAQAQVQQQAAAVSQAEASYRNAERIAQRYRGLVQQGAVSQQDAENQINAATTAQAQLQAAQASLNAARLAASQTRQRMLVIQQGGSQQDVAIARANAAEIAGQIQQLNVQIAQTIIRAPDEGLITKRLAHIGDVVSPGKAMFEMIRRGQLELQAQVTQEDLATIRVGNAAVVTDGTRTVGGQVWEISPVVDPATRLATVRIRIPLRAGFLPGMFARADITTGTKSVLLVPDAAVLSDGAHSYVFIYDHGIVRKRNITIGDHIGATTQIVAGVTTGEPIVVAGAGFLNDGDAVRLGR